MNFTAVTLTECDDEDPHLIGCGVVSFGDCVFLDVS